MARQLVMLDFDGVIVDSLDVTVSATVRYLERHGPQHLATQEAVLSLFDDNWFEGLGRAGVAADATNDLDDTVLRELETRLDEIPAVPGIVEVIDQLSRRHIVVVITSNFAGFVGTLLRRHGITGVAEIMGADEETSKVRKMTAARARYSHPGGCWYVGDTVGDIVEAREAGVPSIAATWGWHSRERLLAAAPDAVAHEPAELAAIVESDGDAGCGCGVPSERRFHVS